MARRFFCAPSHARNSILCGSISLALSASIAGCGGGSPPGVATRDERPAFVVKKGNGVYFGAQANPDAQASDPPSQEQQTELLESQISRRLALHNEYRSWSDLKNITGDMSDAEIAGDITYGRVPVIALHCADNINHANYDLDQIANGDANADLAAIRSALSTLVYPPGSPYAGKPYPIILRWFWEFNLNIDNPPQDPNGNNGCFVDGVSGDPTTTQFIDAWQAIYKGLDGGSGVPNITFMWNPTVAVASSDGDPPAPDSYWPGNSFVDWIGVDGYSKEPAGSGNPETFNDVFDVFFSDFTGSQWGGKPISISETGACQQYSYPYDQGSFLHTAQNQIDTTSPYNNATGGFMYFDAPGSYKMPNGRFCIWTLDGFPHNPSPSGFTMFTDMGEDPNFSQFITPP